MSDDDLRRALAILSVDHSPDDTPDEVAEKARTFADAMNRLERLD